MKTKIINLSIDYPDFDTLIECGNVLRKGGLVIFPTDTVYGIAANNSNPEAIKRLREVKKRFASKPFAVLISQMRDIFKYTAVDNSAFYKLIDKFWPGPLTVIVPSLEEGKSIGVRMPNDIIALRLIQEASCTIAASSANFEGNPEPSILKDALADLDGLVDVAIDGGKSKIGRSSTIVSFLNDKVEILREGAIPNGEILKTANKKIVLFVCTGNSCRSVMAEYILKDRLKDKSCFEVLSAGTAVFLNTAASHETLSVLREEGIDASFHISRNINTILLRKADYIFAMSRNHRNQILNIAPELEDRVKLFRTAVVNSQISYEDIDVPDPMGMSMNVYRKCMDIIKEGIDRILTVIIK